MPSKRLPKPIVLMGGKIELYRGDCCAILPKLAKGVEGWDHVLTDPPYEETIHKAKARKDYPRKLRNDGFAEPKAVSFASINKIRPIITPLMAGPCRGWMIAFCTPEGIAPWRDAIEDAKARYKRACFWIKTDAAPQFNGQGPAYAVEPFVTAWCGKGASR